MLSTSQIGGRKLFEHLLFAQHEDTLTNRFKRIDL